MAGKAVDDAYFAEQSPEKRAILEKLRAQVRKSVPGATVEIKWGVPFYVKNGKMVCSLASFKDFVGINFFAPATALTDPKKQLEGTSKTMRMYKVKTAKDIDSASIARWLKVAFAGK